MEVFNALIDGASVFGLSVYCAGMTLFMGTLAWANYLDARSEEAGRLSEKAAPSS
jgi:hypothetical protein